MEALPPFRLHRPATVEEAVALAAADPGARFVAGGTDMIVNVRRGIERPAALVDLSAVAGFATVTDDGEGLRIGAGVALEALAAHPAMRPGFPAVADAAGAVAGPTHRAYGTVGGNLCLDTRCLYYNQSEWWRAANSYCLKHRGDVCHVAPGGQRCFAAFSGDLAPALLVHDATVEIASPAGRRQMKLAALYRNDGLDHLNLAPGELLCAVRLPAAAAGASAYAKSRIRGSIDFPLAGAAVRLAMDGGNVADLRVALTAVNPFPQLVAGTESFRGRPLDDAALDALRETVRSQARPMKTTTVAPWYRRRVVGALARRLAARLANG
ncbi:MAG: 4-hydroxybenzoyl-CoA reductase subunit beta [Rhodospirillales bacterium]